MREVLDAIDLALGRRARITIPAAPLRVLRPHLWRKFTSDEVFDPAPFAERYGFTARTPLVDGITREVAWLRGGR
jgi:nucleoside-diphosphate-sugar epimerase